MKILQQLENHITQYVKTNESDFNTIASSFEFKRLKKKEIIAEAGKFHNYNYFVLKGCLHMYFIADNGIAKTVQFAIENWWLTDILAYRNRLVSDFYIQAIDATEVLSISYQKEQELLKKIPKLEKYFKEIFQISYGSSLQRIKYLYTYSKEEIYFHFTQHFPEFANRVPQYLIASYLNLTPEYVSEIRSKVLS